MIEPDPVCFDDAAGPVERPYAFTDGRTHPAVELELLSMVRATGFLPRQMDPGHLQTLELCHTATAVVEVAAQLRQPAVVAKILLADLILQGAVSTLVPAVDRPNLPLLEALLDGLRKLQV